MKLGIETAEITANKIQFYKVYLEIIKIINNTCISDQFLINSFKDEGIIIIN